MFQALSSMGVLSWRWWNVAIIHVGCNKMKTKFERGQRTLFACRQAPIHPSHQPYHIAAMWNPEKQSWVFALLYALCFGICSPALQLNRMPCQLMAPMCQWLAFVVLGLFGDIRHTPRKKHCFPSCRITRKKSCQNNLTTPGKIPQWPLGPLPGHRGTPRGRCPRTLILVGDFSVY